VRRRWSLDLLVRRVLLVQQAYKVPLVRRARQEQRAGSVRQVRKVQRVRLAHRVLPVERVRLDPRGLRVPLAVRASRDRPGLPVQPLPCRAPLVLPVPLALLAQRVALVLLVLRVHRVLPVQPGLRGGSARPDRRVLPVPLVGKAFRDLLVPLVLPVDRGRKASRDRPVRQVFPATSSR